MTGADPQGDDDLLRAWEQRLAADGDPLGALAEVLGNRSLRRAELFGLTGRSVLGVALGEILGAGGMGVTYAGKLADGHDVALKMVPGVGAARDDRFAQECRVLQALQHEAIVRYRDHGVLDDGTGVLVMDRIAGLDLDRLLAAVPTAPADAAPPVGALLDEIHAEGSARLQSPRFRRRMLRLLASVADGLHAAHRAGIVHRDVKPANILVRPDLSPVVIDFGLARDQQVKSSFTASGAAMGTLAYMAPEQLGRDPGAVDARTDVYAMGLILFRALLGYEARGDLGDVLHGSRRPFLLDARQSRQLPIDLQAILYRCLDPRPAQRYATAAALADDLRAAAGQGAVAARRPAAVRRFARDRRRLAVVAAAFAAIAAIVTILAWPRGRYVVFQANTRAEDATVSLADGRTAWLGVPIWLPYSRVEVTLHGPGIRTVTAACDVVPGGGTQRVILCTQHPEDSLPEFVPAGRTILQWMTGHGVRQMAPNVPRDERSIDGVVLADNMPFTDATTLAPGRYVLRAKDGRGRSEEQTIELGDQPIDVQCLPAVMSDIDGAFRRTWSTVCSPLPGELSLTGDGERWLGPSKASVLSGAGLRSASAALVPPSEGGKSIVELRCTFSEPMRSAVVYLQGSTTKVGALEVEAGFEGQPLDAWVCQTDGVLASRQEFQCTAGSRAFLVRARMVCDIPTLAAFAQVRFLKGEVFGGHWLDAPPCFALVADPGDAARLPVPTKPPRPNAAPQLALGGVRLVLPRGRYIRSLALLPGPAGAIDLLISYTLGTSERASVTRLAWPSGIIREVVPPERLHALSEPTDGSHFGFSLTTVPDQDGDGWPELVVGDSSSRRRGSINAGTVALLDSDGAVWNWPQSTPASPFRDDCAGTVFPAGDWNGDGFQDLVVCAIDAWSPGGVPKVGLVEVVDSRQGTSLWQWWGQRPRARAVVVDSLPQETGPAALLLWEAVTAGEEDIGKGYSVWVGGMRGRLVESVPALPVDSIDSMAAVLVAGRKRQPFVVSLRVGGTAQAFCGLERFEVGQTAIELSAKKPVDLRFDHSTAWRFDYPQAMRLPDLDGDGFDDVAFALLKDTVPGILFVSSQNLELLGFCPLPKERGQMQDLHAATWVPEFGNTAAQLVVAMHDPATDEITLQGIPFRH